jgi:hypothetical protein
MLAGRQAQKPCLGGFNELSLSVHFWLFYIESVCMLLLLLLHL